MPGGIFDSILGGGSTDQNRQINRQTQNAQLGYIDQGQTEANKDIRFGMRQAVPAINQGVQAFQPWQSAGVQGVSMIPNALGLGGQEGYDAAIGAFQNSPGFQAALDRANQNVLRNNAQMGNVASGATGIALSDRARELQNLDYNNWIQNLFNLSGQGLQGAGGMASGLTNLANLWRGGSQDLANVATGAAANRSNIAGQYGQNQATLNNQADANNAAKWAAILNLGGQAAGALAA